MTETIINVIAAGRFQFARYLHTAVLSALLILLLVNDRVFPIVEKLGSLITVIILYQIGCVTYLVYHNSIAILFHNWGSVKKRDYFSELGVSDWKTALRRVRSGFVDDKEESNLHRVASEINVIHVTGIFMIIALFGLIEHHYQWYLYPSSAIVGCLLIYMAIQLDRNHSIYLVKTLKGMNKSGELEQFLRLHDLVDKSPTASNLPNAQPEI